MPYQEIELNDNENDLVNDEEPVKNDTNDITDAGSVNDDNEQERNNDNDLNDTHVMDEIPEEVVIFEDNNNE